jgi:hypothetical protein
MPHRAEKQEKVPQIHPHLDAVGIAVAVISRIRKENSRRKRLRWTHASSIHERGILENFSRKPEPFLCSMSTSDAIAISAAIVGAGLTLFALVIAGVALFGVSGLRNYARQIAEREAMKQVLEIHAPESEAWSKMKGVLDARLEATADKLWDDMKLADLSPKAKPSTGESPSSPSASGEYPNG